MSTAGGKKRQVSVKLSRTSSARPLLYAKQNKTEVNHLAHIIDESRALEKESGRGKIPLEAAYICMKRITEMVGHPIDPVGMSVYNRLHSLRTDHALELLRKHTWNEFFTRPNEGNPQHTS
jgi:hypothetical protein